MPGRLLRSTLVCRFIEQLLIVPEGRLVGQPFKLLPFQKRFIKAVYDNPAGTRRGLLSIGRKNGKTGLMAALLMTHLIGPLAVRNAQLISGARSRDQAALLWSLAAKMVELNPVLQDFVHVVPSQKRLVGLPMSTEFRALSADAAKNMGISPAVAFLDEVGQVVGPKDNFTGAIESAQGAHDDPLLLAISTQSPSDADMFSLWIDDALRSNDPHTVCHVYAADDECDLMSKAQWRKANPALGKFLNEKYLAQEMAKAERMPSEEAKARNLHLNQRIAQESLWLAPKVWKENSGAPDIEVLREKGAHLGLDLSLRNDLTAAALAAADDDKVIHLDTYAFTPQGGLEDRSRRDKVPYDDWVRQGIIEAPPGDTISYDWIAQFLKVDLKRRGIALRSIQFDRWKINEFKAACERQGFAQDVEWVAVGQGFFGFSSRVQEFENLLLERRVRHGNHPILNLGAASAIAVSDPTGNRKLDKNKSSQKIDGLVAALMAAHPLTLNEQEFNAEAMIG